ncbi:flagellar basal-body rod protein FlgB [bacterium F16]|nr:flagellar basal-body rod protein FlgB [bacterium F16]
MNGPDLIDNTSLVLSKMSDLAMERHRVISNNIANASTPGYKRRELSFEGLLGKLLKSGNVEEAKSFKGQISIDEDSPSRMDGNNVSIASETNSLLENTLYHNLLSQALKTKMSIMKAAITGGGR